VNDPVKIRPGLHPQRLVCTASVLTIDRRPTLQFRPTLGTISPRPTDSAIPSLWWKQEQTPGHGGRYIPIHHDIVQDHMDALVQRRSPEVRVEPDLTVLPNIVEELALDEVEAISVSIRHVYHAGGR
jgi:hypothetical protein